MMNTQNLTFGEFLQRKREEKQITLRKMAEMLHVSAPYLSDIEKGRRNPPEMEKLEQISQILLLTDEEKSAMLDLAGKMRNSVAPDLPEYIRVKEEALADSLRSRDWAKKMLVNIARAGYFSADRTIREYNRDIWKLF